MFVTVPMMVRNYHLAITRCFIADILLKELLGKSHRSCRKDLCACPISYHSMYAPNVFLYVGVAADAEEKRVQAELYLTTAHMYKLFPALGQFLQTVPQLLAHLLLVFLHHRLRHLDTQEGHHRELLTLRLIL